MTEHPIDFIARSCHKIASDRIYRIEIRDALYFLRTGGQFNVERDDPSRSDAHAAAGAILAVGEALFRKHKREESLARDLSQHPEELLEIHPHNFKLMPADIRSAVFLPKRWYAALRLHFGRLVLHLRSGEKWEFEFERLEDLRIAFAAVPRALGKLVETEIAWNDQKARFDKAPRHPVA